MKYRKKLFRRKRRQIVSRFHIRRLVCALLLLAVISLLFIFVSERNRKQEKGKLDKQVSKISDIYTLEYQEKVKERLDKAKEGGRYTEDSILTERDPFGTNTLSLYVYFETETPAQVSYCISVEDEQIPDFSAMPKSEDTAETEHEFQVIGLVPDMDNTVTFTVTYEDGSQRNIQHIEKDISIAGEEETRLKTEDCVDNAERQLTDGLYVILGNDSDEADYMYYYDNAGVLRGEIPLIGYRSHRLLFQDGLMYYSISEDKIAAVDCLGMVQRVYDLGRYELHHDYVFDSDGDLLILATDTDSNTVEDQVIRIDMETGDITGRLDLRELFPDYLYDHVDADAEELDWIHVNTLQHLEDETLILSSRETSTILKISDAFSEPQIEYMIGESSFWEDTGYEQYLLAKDESSGSFSDTGGQHSVTYVEDDSLPDGQYYLYMFNNNFGTSESREFDWSVIPGIEESVDAGKDSYYYKYLVDEKAGTYQLVESFAVPFSAYVSSAQEYGTNRIIDSGMAGIFGEYDPEGSLIREYEMKLAKKYIYRVYKYDFSDFFTLLNEQDIGGHGDETMVG